VSTTQRQGGGSGYLERPKPSGLADVVEVILDKGLVIDAYVRVSLIGIEILTIDARIVIASVDTYLRFAEATNRLDLYEKNGKDLPEMVEGVVESGSKGKASGMIGAAKDALTSSDDDDDDDDDQKRERRPARRSSSSSRPRRRQREAE
jgi:hypothetical protein